MHPRAGRGAHTQSVNDPLGSTELSARAGAKMRPARIGPIRAFGARSDGRCASSAHARISFGSLLASRSVAGSAAPLCVILHSEFSTGRPAVNVEKTEI